MPPRKPAGRRKLPLRRRLLFIGVAVVLMALLAEGMAFVVYSVLQGELFSYAVVRAEQTAVVSEVDDEQAVGEDGFRDLRIHPYLGYAYPHLLLDELAKPPDREEFRILVLGGSVAGNFLAMGRQPLIAALESEPAMEGRKVVVKGYPLGGFKQPQQLLALTYLLALGASFDVVMCLDGFNEIVLPVTDNLPFGVHPFYPRSWHHLADVRDPGLRRRIAELSWLRGLRRRWARGFLDSSLGWSVTAQLVWKVRDHLLAVEIAERVTDLYSLRSDRTTAQTAKLEELGFDGEDTTRSRLAEFWARCSIEIERLCAAHGINYLHYLQPNQYAGTKPMDAAETRVAIDYDDPYAVPARDGYPHLRAQADLLHAAGVHFRDLTELYDDEPRPVYTDSCCHLNELGCRLIAEQVARDIAAR